MAKVIGDMTLYDVEELEELLDVQAKTIRKYLREGKLKGRKMARKWYVTEDNLREYFEKPEEPEALIPSAEEPPDWVREAWKQAEAEIPRRQGQPPDIKPTREG